MQLKALMVDVDGVLVVQDLPEGWSRHLERDLGLSREILQREFFDRHWAEVVTGRAELRPRLRLSLDAIGSRVSAEELVDYWFRNDARVDAVLLDSLVTLKSTGLALHLATTQEHERARYLWHDLGLGTHFDAIHYAAEIGTAKPDPRFFAGIEERTGLGAQEVLLIDDSERNVMAARAQGWRAEHWTAETKLADILAEHRRAIA